MQVINFYTKKQAIELTGGATQTSKMPCKSYSLPTEACITGAKFAKDKSSICGNCYANKGFYKMYAKTIKPAQNKRLESIQHPEWVSAMVSLIGKDSYFRWHDSGDLQSVDHLHKIAQVAIALPKTLFWLPTREYGIVKNYIEIHGALPENLIVRLSAFYVDKPVIIPKSLQGYSNILASNVHAHAEPVGMPCNAPKQGGECKECRACWDSTVPAVSYGMH